jgi:hypothetical protein
VVEPGGALVRAVIATSGQARFSYNVREPETAISEFIALHNDQPKPFIWTKTVDAILSSIGRFASCTLQVHGANNM